MFLFIVHLSLYIPPHTIPINPQPPTLGGEKKRESGDTPDPGSILLHRVAILVRTVTPNLRGGKQAEGHPLS
jgi:hypothetical protein